MPWYTEFFGEDYMRFHLLGGEREQQRAPEECDFVVSELGLQPGDRVLDLCCGQGRHAVELARRGLKVTGLDLSAYLLGLARQAAAEAAVEIEFVRRDMRDLPWEDEFDAVINMFTAFGYLESDEEDERVLTAVRKALRPSGRLLLDLPTPEMMADRRGWYEHEGCLVLDEDSWDALRGRWHRERTVIGPGGDRKHYEFTLRVYSHPEVISMLGRAGLQWQRTSAGYDGADFGRGSRRMLVVTQKPG